MVIKLDTENQMLRAQFFSDSTIEAWKNAQIQVERLSEETGIRRVLVDIQEQTVRASTSKLYEFGSQLLGFMAFAVLCDITNKDYYFIESVAKNRGINTKLFDSEEDAVEWLRKWPNKIMDNDKK